MSFLKNLKVDLIFVKIFDLILKHKVSKFVSLGLSLGLGKFLGVSFDLCLDVRCLHYIIGLTRNCKILI